MEEIYQPEEDSFFLSDTLKNHLRRSDRKINILDMGSGSGIQAKTCLNLRFTHVTASDINKEAIKSLKDTFKKKIKIIKSDLFSNINRKFDLIIFNPPYLPEHKFDSEKDTTGGKKGFEIILKFLKQAKKNLNSNGEIIILFSSLSNPDIIKKTAETIGYKSELIAKKSLFFEELFIYTLKLKH